MNIWKGKDSYYTREALTTVEIERIENEKNVSFPISYIKLLQIQNGGILIHNALRVNFENSWYKDHLPFIAFYGMSYDFVKDTSDSTLAEWGIKGKNILISGDGTYLFFLHYKNGNIEPSVYYFDLSTGDYQKVASTFEELLSKLYLHDYSEVDALLNGLETSQVVDFKELIRSGQKEDVIGGLTKWICSEGPTKELVIALFSQLKASEDEDVVMFVAEELTRLVLSGDISDYLSSVEFLSVLEEKKELNLKIYIDMINEE